MKMDAFSSPADSTGSERSPLPLVAAGAATIQATETRKVHEQFVAMNEALMLGAVRQHELTEAAENLIVQLQGEIASHKKTAVELAEKARLLELTTDAIFVRDEEGRILFWNHGAEVLYGWSRADALGKNSHVLLRTEFTTPLEQIEAELHQHNRWTGELVHTKCNGRRITVLVRKTQELDAQGKPASMLENITDITERKQAAADKEKLEVQNRQLQKSESLGRMAGAIAHHFNNQLQGVMLNLQLAMNNLPENQRPVEGLIGAMQSARKAAEVSTLMLTYLGQAQVKNAPLDLTEVCRQSLALLRSTMPPSVVLETDLPTSGPVISANANQLQQILTNLTNNAREACREGRGAIRVSVNTVAAADRGKDHSVATQHAWRAQDRSQPLKYYLKKNPDVLPNLRTFVLNSKNGMTVDFEKIVIDLAALWTEANGHPIETDAVRDKISSYYPHACVIKSHEKMDRVFETARRHLRMDSHRS